MNWAIERDENGFPRRMVYMGHLAPKPKQATMPPPGCPGCGFHFGWHALGCKQQKRAGQPGASHD